MDSYYAVERSPDFLAHYGIKGMRWGVQKAKYKGDDKALGRHYAKAQKKIQKYKDRMNIDKQKEAYDYHHNKFIRSALATSGAGAIGIGGLLGAKAIRNKRLPASFINVFTNDATTGRTIRVKAPVYDSASSRLPNALTGIGLAGAAAELGLAAKTGYHGVKALSAEFRTTKKGHQKAVNKYAPKVNEWQREVNKAFKGTKYANDASGNSKKKRR